MDISGNNNISGKNILIIGVKFYHYNEEIIKKLRSRGANVTFFFERDITIKHAIVDTFFNSHLDKWQERHYNNILNSIRGNHFDYLLVIRGYKITGEFIAVVKSLNPGIKTIMYQWDSLANSNYKEMIPHFDRVYTFDLLDSENLSLKYVPTFHTDEFMDIPDVPQEYDLFFYGNFTYERYQQMLLLKKYAENNGYVLKTHLHIAWKRFLRERIRGLKIVKEHITFERMSKEQYFDLFSKSRVIVDFTTNSQSGLAMRVLDALAAGKKIITNNPYITRIREYDARQILVVNINDLDIPKTFLNSGPTVKSNYSIDKWINNIFDF